MRGAQWEPEEERRLVANFLAGQDLAWLVADHARTEAAIVSRLALLELVIYVPRTRSYHAVSREPWGKVMNYPKVERPPPKPPRRARASRTA